jgi:hypothetical protein
MVEQHGLSGSMPQAISAAAMPLTLARSSAGSM